MLTVVTWRWGKKYSPEHVSRLKAGVARNLAIPHRFICITDQADTPGDTLPIEDEALLSVRDGCYCRLRMFDPAWQLRHGIERLVCLDLDMVITGPLGPLFDRPEPFMIRHGGHWNPCKFNGSVMAIARCARPEIWKEFTVEKADKFDFEGGVWRGSDQTWIAHMAPDAPGWTHADGIYGYKKRGWPGYLPSDARIVTFNGRRDPSSQTERWVAQHWAA
jgi:hypothetical protein